MVDDHAPWRQQIAALLQKTEEWLVIGEAADGPEAVAMAAAAVPDLILLDLELPSLSGIDTAARIFAANPSSHILYLTGHSSWEVVEAALVGGARGYVVKPYAALELLPAMAAVGAGRRFVSAVLGGRAPSACGQPTPHVHEAAFHQNDRTLLAEYEAFAAAALSRGKAVIGAGDAACRHALVDGLRLRGIDIARAIEEGRFRMLDTVEMLRPMMVDGMPMKPASGRGHATGAPCRARLTPESSGDRRVWRQRAEPVSHRQHRGGHSPRAAVGRFCQDRQRRDLLRLSGTAGATRLRRDSLDAYGRPDAVTGLVRPRRAPARESWYRRVVATQPTDDR